MSLDTYVRVIDTVKPQEGKNYPVVEAQDVLMPDGSRLSDINFIPKLFNGESVIMPDRYYVFGEVDNLSLTLKEVSDGCVHEYCFEFIPSENFTDLNISPQPSWVSDPQYSVGKTCQVSILRGIAVMLCA